MTDEQMLEEIQKDVKIIASKYAANRIRLSILDYDLDYQLNQQNDLSLKTKKLLVRTLGKTTKVLIGDTEKYKTRQEAEEGTKEYWVNYYKSQRANRTPEERQRESVRQRRYREEKRLREQAAISSEAAMERQRRG